MHVNVRVLWCGGGMILKDAIVVTWRKCLHTVRSHKASNNSAFALSL